MQTFQQNRQFLLFTFASTLIPLLLAVFSGRARAQNGQGGMPNPHRQSDREEAKPIQKLTVHYKNGTPNHDSIKGIRAWIITRENMENVKNIMKNPSQMPEEKGKYVIPLNIGEDGNATISLEERTLTHPVLVTVYKEGFYLVPLHGKPELEKNVTVYEPTDDPSVLRVQMHHVPIQRGNQQLMVQEVIGIKNTSKRAYIGPEGPRTLSISVPRGVSRVRFHEMQSGSRNMENKKVDQNRKIWISRTLTPDRPRFFRLQYPLPISDGSASFSLPVDYQTEQFRLVMPEGNYELQSNKTVQRDTDSRRVDRKVARVEASNLSPGETIDVRLKGLSGNESGTGTSGTEDPEGPGLALILIGVASTLALLISGYHLFFRPPGPGPNTNHRASTRQTGDNQPLREHLKEEIARLDKSLEEGEISESYHEKTRERLKNQLMELEQEWPEEPA